MKMQRMTLNAMTENRRNGDLRGNRKAQPRSTYGNHPHNNECTQAVEFTSPTPTTLNGGLSYIYRTASAHTLVAGRQEECGEGGEEYSLYPEDRMRGSKSCRVLDHLDRAGVDLDDDSGSHSGEQISASTQYSALSP